MKTVEIEVTKQTAELSVSLLNQALAKGMYSKPRLKSFGACAIAALTEWVSAVPKTEYLYRKSGRHEEWHDKLDLILDSGDMESK